MHLATTPATATTAETAPRRATRRHHRSAALLLTAASFAALAGGIAASPAGAAIFPATPPITMTPVPRPCYILICRDATTFAFNTAGYYTYATATFPSGASGTVTFRMHCADGWSKTVSKPIAGYVSAPMLVKDVHPVAQSCTMTQTAPDGFTTTASLVPPDSDILWAQEIVKFTNS